MSSDLQICTSPPHPIDNDCSFKYSILTFSQLQGNLTDLSVYTLIKNLVEVGQNCVESPDSVL